MGKKIYNHLFPVPAREKKTPFTSSLCFPPASAPSAELYFVIHVTLRLGAVNTLAFISYTTPPPPPFTTVKTCGAKKIIYGCLCPFQSSSGPGLPGECRWAHIFGLADLTRGRAPAEFFKPLFTKKKEKWTPELLIAGFFYERLNSRLKAFFAVIAHGERFTWQRICNRFLWGPCERFMW